MHSSSLLQGWIRRLQHDRSRARLGRRLITATLALLLIGACGSAELSTQGVEVSTESVDLTVPVDTQEPSLSETSTSFFNPAVEFYARDYSVSEAEAARRLDRMDGIYDVIGSIRDMEAERLAGWGIDHEGKFTGWVWLTGSDAPSSEAAALANEHEDVEIRLGAIHTLQDLLDAQDRFGDGRHIGPVGQAADYSGFITFTSVDMDTNTLHIGIDPALAPAEVRSGWLDDDATSMVTSSATDAELQAAITKLETDFRGSISVAYKVVDGRNIAADG